VHGHLSHNDPMKSVSVAEAKAHFSDLLAAAEQRGRVTVVEKHGRPIAQIGPLPRGVVRPSGTRALAKFEAAFAKLNKQPSEATTSALAELEAGRGRLA
jgi:prevent-host-death family protein